MDFIIHYQIVNKIWFFLLFVRNKWHNQAAAGSLSSSILAQAELHMGTCIMYPNFSAPISLITQVLSNLLMIFKSLAYSLVQVQYFHPYALYVVFQQQKGFMLFPVVKNWQLNRLLLTVGGSIRTLKYSLYAHWIKTMDLWMLT